jgi:hypothetical protein
MYPVRSAKLDRVPVALSHSRVCTIRTPDWTPFEARDASRRSSGLDPGRAASDACAAHAWDRCEIPRAALPTLVITGAGSRYAPPGPISLSLAVRVSPRRRATE